MGTVFQSITAELSKDFEDLLTDKYAKNFLERVCDVTGTLMLCNSNTVLDAPDSLKICGTWASVSQAHSILSAYTILNELLRSEFDGNENFAYDTTTLMNEYSPSPNRKRKGCYEISDEFPPNSSVIRKSMKRKTKNKAEILQKNDILPVPVLLSSVDSAVKSLVYPPTDNLQQNKFEVSNSNYSEYESDIYFVENQDSTIESIVKNRAETVDEMKDVFHCAMCKYTTNSAKNLESHLDRYHFKPVTCQICGRGFGYDRDLKRHLMKNKYSCGSHRSVINKNYVNLQKPEISADEQSSCYVNLQKPEISTDEQSSCFADSYEISINKPENEDMSYVSDQSDTHNTTLEEEKNTLQNIQQENPVDENFVLQIKQEPVYMYMEGNETEEATHHNNSSGHSSVALENQFCVQENLARKSTSGRKKSKEKDKRSSCEMNFEEDLNKSSDSTDIASNVGFRSKEMEHYKQSDRELSDNSSNYEDDFSTTQTRAKVNKMTFSCKHCSYTALKKQHIIDHICRMHKKQFQCEHCHSAFGLIKDLHRHLRRTHGVDIPFKKCRPMTMPLVPL